MKKTKILIPALGLLVLSTAASVTGTVAWFSANTTASATGMQVNVQSTNTFLLINTGDNDTASEIQTANVTTVALSVTDQQASVFPSSPILSTYVSSTASVDVANHKYFASGTTVVSDYATAAVPANWFTALNSDPTSANNSVKGINVLDSTGGNYDFSKYVIKRTAYLTVAVGSNDADDLTVTPTILPKGFSVTQDTTAADGKLYYSYSAGVFTKQTISTGAAVTEGWYEITAASGAASIDMSYAKVLVATDDGGFDIMSVADNGVAQDISGTNTAITSSTVRTVDIYIYVDGEHTDINTNNLPNLLGASIDLSFDVQIAY